MKYWLYPKVKINSILSGRESFRRFTDVYYCSYLDVHWYGGKRDQSRHCRLDNIMYQLLSDSLWKMRFPVELIHNIVKTAMSTLVSFSTISMNIQIATVIHISKTTEALPAA